MVGLAVAVAGGLFVLWITQQPLRDAVHDALGIRPSAAARVEAPQGPTVPPAVPATPMAPTAPAVPAPVAPTVPDPELAEPPPLEAPAARDLATLELGQIAIDVAAWEFDRAREALERALVGERDEAIVRALGDRLVQVKAYQGLLGGLIRDVEGGLLGRQTVELPGLSFPLRFTAADALGFEAQTAQGARVRERWTNLTAEARYALLERVATGAEALWALAELFAEMGRSEPLRALAERALARLWLAHEDQRPRVSERWAQLRAEPVPAAGYVVHERRLVSPAERDALERGLVRFRGQWVTPADREHLAKNHVRIDGEWVAQTPAQLAHRGFVEYKGRWYTRDDYLRQRQEWADAWEYTGRYWTVRCNESEEAARRIAGALDQVHERFYERLRKAVGGIPPAERDRPLVAFAFATHDEYRDYCRSIGQAEFVQHKGFIRPRQHQIGAWRWIDDDGEVLRTLAHRAARLLWAEHFADPPFWLITGFGISFEGLDYDERTGELTVEDIPKGALGALTKAIAAQTLADLEALLAPTAAGLLSEVASRKVVPAQCWGLVHFLEHSTDSREQKAWASVMRAAVKGQAIDLATLTSGDRDDFERRWRNYVRRIKPPGGRWLGGGCGIR